jgi:hypothetical protein
MAENRPNTRQEAYDSIVKQINANKDKLNKAIASGEVANDSRAIIASKYYKENSRLQAQLRSTGPIGELGAGMVSAATGLLTGIPDLGIAGYNLYTEKRAPTMSELVTGKPAPIKPLRERVMEFAGMSPEATSNEGAMLQAAPDIAVGVYGAAQLAKLGYSGLKNWLNTRKTKELLSKLSPEEGNVFRDLMLKGQGSSNTELAAQIAKLESDPKFGELLASLKREASVRSVQGMTPAASKLSEEQAAVGSAKAVQSKLDKLSEARKLAGDQSFSKAFGYGEGRQLVDPVKTVAEIDTLIARYSKQTTGNAERAVEVLNNLKDKLTTPTAPRSPFTGVGGGIQPTNLKTVEEVQGILSEFGKKASQGDSLIKDLALSDEKIISSAVFGGMKDDLVAAFKEASGADRTALGMLIRARKEVSNASTAYTDAVAQGIPSWLKDKRLAEINFEDLYSQYRATTPAQRATFRSYVQNTEPEALKSLDSRVWTDFTKKYISDLPDGLPGIDIASMSRDWAKMSAVEKDAVATALGQNTATFSERMKDALIFTRKLQVGAGEDISGRVVRDAAAVAGSTPLGYQGSKVVQLLGGILTSFKSGVVSNELALKTLLTDEGAAFLKTAALSPGSRKTLEELTKVTQSQGVLPTVAQISTAVAPSTATPAEAPFVVPEEFKVPTTEAPLDQQQQPQQQPEMAVPEDGGFVVPEEFRQQQQQTAPMAPVVAAPVKSRADMSRTVLNDEVTRIQGSLATTKDPVQQGRLQRDLEAVLREIARLR